jgi:PAB-dependent poly(A)-specific ribonuclease subunit 2
VDKPIYLMKRGKLIACASAAGEVHLRDPRNLDLQHTLSTHPAGIFDMDLQGNLLITCGYGERADRLFSDKMIKVFDLRTLRALPPVPFPPSPFALKFHPRFTTVAAVLSQSGMYQFAEVGTPGAVPTVGFNQLAISGQTCTAFDLSVSGEVLVVGDSLGLLHQCSDRPSSVLNSYARTPDLAAPLVIPSFDIEEDTPLSVVGMPHYDEMLLSSWAAHQTYTVGQPPTPLDPDVLANIKQKDFVGYAPNPGTCKRNQAYRKTKGGVERPKFRSEQERDHEHGSRNKV